jgi:CBS domain containing-hemolysin-like protein
MALLILYALTALFFSFLCSILEAVLLSVTPSFVLALENQGHRSGKMLAAFKLDVNRPLAAILSLNTIAHTVGAAGVGAQAASVFGSSSVGVTSAVLTLLILVFSEIIPKTLGARYWRSLAPTVAYGLVVLIWLMYPFVLLARGTTRILAGGGEQQGLSRDELKAMAELGERAGLFRDRESSILRNLFRFPSLMVEDIMTPRPVLFALEANRTVEEVLQEHPEIAFSRIPIYLKDIDAIIGYVLQSDLQKAHLSGEKASPLISVKRTILSVPHSLPLSNFFDHLLDSREHIALVVDEFGGTAGIATMEDVVETLLGLEIVDEADTAEDMQALARSKWEKRARRLGLVHKDSP